MKMGVHDGKSPGLLSEVSLLLVSFFSPAMASSSRALLAWLLFFTLALYLVHSSPVFDPQMEMSSGRSLLQKNIDCPSACRVRCGRSWKLKMCLKLCGICCSKCSCVPPGTSAEARAVCPCYANMRNPKGQYKCP